MAAAQAAEEAGFDDFWVAEHHFMSYGSALQRSSWRVTC
ncbi:MAG TPA: LLM class flavin-dependent oxidoreductase, partial [Pseudonocardiaceae bacterium]|nr:LLM class flavin-dependent oxidoreductase [Pseudonocardiaceae bacterium]